MKHDMNADTQDRARVEEAAQWFVDLDHESEGTDKPVDPGEWRRWYQDEANATEFDGMVEFVEDLRARYRLDMPTPELVRRGLIAEGSGLAEEFARRTDGYGPESPRRIWVKRLSVVCGLLAAGVLVAALAMTVNPRSWISDGFFARSETYQTIVGEHREVVMSDGSRITLGGKSVIKTAFTSTQRLVELQEGEALFNVAHDATRPFTVVAGRGSIQAVGTAFNVLREGRRVVVTVSEGSVLVAPNETPGGVSAARPDATGAVMWKAAALQSGQEMSYREDGSATAVQASDVAAALSWRSGRLQYLQQPLSNVIADVNRYSKKHIDFDPDVGAFVYTGDVVPPKIEAWVENLPEIFPLSITKSDSNRIYLRLRDDSVSSKN